MDMEEEIIVMLITFRKTIKKTVYLYVCIKLSRIACFGNYNESLEVSKLYSFQ